MQLFDETPYRLRESGILNRSLWHMSVYIDLPGEIQETVKNGLGLEPPSEATAAEHVALELRQRHLSLHRGDRGSAAPWQRHARPPDRSWRERLRPRATAGREADRDRRCREFA